MTLSDLQGHSSMQAFPNVIFFVQLCNIAGDIVRRMVPLS